MIAPVPVGVSVSLCMYSCCCCCCFPTGLWAIVSNAGFNVMGDVEFCSVNLYNKAWNVNFLGAIRTIQNFLYLVRRHKGKICDNLQ